MVTQIAKGEYIAFVDSDDLLECDYLKILYETAKKENADVVSCGYKTIDIDNHIQNYSHIPIQLNGGINALNELISRQFMVSACLKMYKCSFLQENKLLFRSILGEDILFHFMVIYFCKKFIAIPDSLYCYFQSSQSITRGKYNTKWIKTFFEILKHVEEFIKEIQSENIGLNPIFELRIYKYFFEAFFSPTFLGSFHQSKVAQKVLEEKLLQYFPENHRYVFLLIHELIESKNAVDQYQQHIRFLEISTPALAQANQRRKLANFMLRLNKQEWEGFVDTKAYELYWEFIYKISWQEQRLPREDKEYHELQQYIIGSIEVWKSNCIYFAMLLYEKPWNISFMPKFKQLSERLLDSYLKYVGHIVADQAECNNKKYINFFIIYVELNNVYFKVCNITFV